MTFATRNVGAARVGIAVLELFLVSTPMAAGVYRHPALSPLLRCGYPTSPQV